MATLNQQPTSNGSNGDSVTDDNGFEVRLSKYFKTLHGAGVEATLAAAYALKWASGTAAPIDVPRLRSLCNRLSDASGSESEASVKAEIQELAVALFAHPDSLVLSLAIHCSGADASDAAPKEQVQVAALEDSDPSPSVSEPGQYSCAARSEASSHPLTLESLEDDDDAVSDDDSDPPQTDARSAADAVVDHSTPDGDTSTDPAATQPAATSSSSHAGYGRELLTIDLEAASDLMTTLFAATDRLGITEAVTVTLRSLVQDTGKLQRSLQWSPAIVQAQVLAVLLLLPQMQEVSNQPFMSPFMELCMKFKPICAPALQRTFAAAPKTLRASAVFAVQQFMTLRLYTLRAVNKGVATAAALLETLHAANASSQSPISHEAFYNNVVNSPDFDLQEDWDRSRHPTTRLFSFCRYPFLYGPAAKAKFIKYDTVDSMSEGVVNMLLNAPGGRSHPMFVLTVRRDHLMSDALMRIREAMQQDLLKKPLKVRFVGEQGVDEGGVAKEFFQLLVQECFSPNYGMFEDLPDTNTFWVRPSALSELSEEFELIGIIIGLAIYNAHVLTLSFSLPIYKKLLDQPVGFEDLRHVHPEVHASLKALLEWPAHRVEADMGLTFQVEYMMDFCTQTKDLIPNGANVPVTGANRRRFVDAYANFLLNDLVAPQFEAFRRGFRRVCDSDVFRMFNAPELEAVVCGARDVDFAALRRGALYDGGYKSDTDVVQWFWNVVNAYSENDKRRFLQFVTSSERVPIGGLESLEPPFCVVRNGPHSDRLPTAHTCFNTLLLPEYESEEFLRDRLALALQNSQGFGLM